MDLIRSGRGGRVATANLDFLALARTNPVLLDDLRRSSLVVADGMPVVWLARSVGARRIQRTTGVDLVEAICRDADSVGTLRIAMYGSTPERARRAASHLERLSTGVQVVAAISPPFRKLSEAETNEHRESLSVAMPNVVLVAMGCPAQERLIAEWFHHIPGALWIGVGGTFDFFAGERKRAPKLFQATGTEWIVRMVQEPRRLGRRYLGRDLPALLKIAPISVGQALRRSRRTNAD